MPLIIALGATEPDFEVIKVTVEMIQSFYEPRDVPVIIPEGPERPAVDGGGVVYVVGHCQSGIFLSPTAVYYLVVDDKITPYLSNAGCIVLVACEGLVLSEVSADVQLDGGIGRLLSNHYEGVPVLATQNSVDSLIQSGIYITVQATRHNNQCEWFVLRRGEVVKKCDVFGPAGDMALLNDGDNFEVR